MVKKAAQQEPRASKASKVVSSDDDGMPTADDLAGALDRSREERMQRIIHRARRMLLFGIIMDFMQSSGGGEKKDEKKRVSKASKSPKASAERPGLVEQVKKIVDSYSGLLMVLFFTLLMFGVRLGEDTYLPSNIDESGPNFYDVMGVPRDSSAFDIKRAYKKLAVVWHPDKNPNCTKCEQRFAEISAAYAVLGDDEKREKYNQKRKSKERATKSSGASTVLTDESFAPLVLSSSDIWFLHVYDREDSDFFEPVWIEMSEKLREVARFGSLEHESHKIAAEMLPQRIVVSPIIFAYNNGRMTGSYVPSGRERGNDAQKLFNRFVEEQMPQVKQFPNSDSTGALKVWWEQDGERPKVLVLYGLRATMKGGFASPGWMRVRGRAHFWGETIDFAVAHTSSLKPDLLGEIEGLAEPLREIAQERANSIPAGVQIVIKQAGAARLGKLVESIEALSGEFDDLVPQLAITQAPFLTMRNHEQLCGMFGQVRRLCLPMVDMSAKAVKQAMDELAESRALLLAELQEMKEATVEDDDGDSVVEEPPLIQAVQLSTRSPRFPSQPPASYRPGFHALRAAVDGKAAFLIELSTHRTVVTPKSLHEVYQKVAYDDFQFVELPESLQSPLAWLADPAEPLKKQLKRDLMTWTGMFAALVVIVGVGSVLPELTPVQAAGTLAGLWGVVTLVWKPLFRTTLSVLFGA
eukprot:NODE_1980_length_2319_cov_6.305657.p1 GENE.NODE_1980_length_2319_cov_6.305657~~NODE_1980_length_2319_cov_6.305657.p1  ORF type:complete len:722 (-),score=250.75 NODE_1980_length_2319_cov_6.305657:153-2234(-)